MSIAPKRKHSHSRKNMRRSNVWKLEADSFSTCTQCGELKMPHRMCGNCGYYNGKQIVKMES